MKKAIYILPLLAALALSTFNSCDRVEMPYPVVDSKFDTTLYPGTFAVDYPWPVFSTSSNTERKVLIEDFTGHHCSSCPQAAVEADVIKATDPSNIYIVGVHAGPQNVFQEHSNPGDGNYPMYARDFTTEAGTAYVEDIAGMLGNPQGMINRTIPAAKSNPWLFYFEWASEVAAQRSANNLTFNIQTETNFFPSTKGLFVHNYVEAVQARSGDYTVVNYLIRDSIVDWQLSGSIDVPDYVHKHVLIDNVNGTYGERFAQNSVSAGDNWQLDYTYVIPDSLDVNGLSIISYVMDMDTYEILQVTEHHLDQ